MPLRVERIVESEDARQQKSLFEKPFLVGPFLDWQPFGALMAGRLGDAGQHGDGCPTSHGQGGVAGDSQGSHGRFNAIST